MDKLRIIQHAQGYMQKLSNGIDPISGKPVPEDSTLQQERLRKCFGFVAEILEELIQNNGTVLLSGVQNKIPTSTEEFDEPPIELPVESTTNDHLVAIITPQQIQNIEITSTPILPSAFVKKIGAVVDASTKKKVSLARINRWLLKQGYLAETKVRTIVNKSVKVTTPLSAEIGVVEHLVVDKKTGEAKTQLFFSEDAQKFILNNINNIANE